MLVIFHVSVIIYYSLKFPHLSHPIFFKRLNLLYILEKHVCPKKCCKIMNIYHTKIQWVTHANEPTWSFVNMFIKCKGFNRMIEWIMCKLTLNG